MRILLNLLAAKSGGQKKRAIAFVDNIIQQFPELDVVILKYKFSLNEVVSRNNIEVIDLEILGSKLENIRRMLWENLYLKSVIRDKKCDVLLTFSHYLPFRSLDVQTVVAVSNLAPFNNHITANETWLNWIRLKILRHTIINSVRNASAVIALSEMCRRVLIKHGVDQSKITVIPNGVEHRVTPKEIDNPTNIDVRPILILSVSHFYRYKNFEQLLYALNIFKNRSDHQVKLQIVGKFQDKKYHSEICQLIEDLDLLSIAEIIPELPPRELYKLYEDAHLFVFPSLVENSPNILLEAMSHGLPILAANVEPMPEYGLNSVKYFEAHDNHDLAVNIEKLITNKKIRDEMASLALARSYDFSWKTFTKDVINLCKEKMNSDL